MGENIRDDAQEDNEKARVSDTEKELAAEASSAYNSGDFNGCLTSLEKLEILRPSDLVLAHNKIVVQCKQSQSSSVGSNEDNNGGRTVALSEVVQQLETLARTIGVSLTGAKTLEDMEGTNAVLVYNLALARFQQRHVLQASQLASRLMPLSPNISPSFARKILFFQCELSLALHQPEQALEHAVALEELITETQKKQAGEQTVNLEQSRLFVLRARCNVMARLTKTLKKELKSVSLPGTLGHTTEFVRSHIEALHSNHKKSIKMLNSVVQMAGNRVFPHYYNNLGCLHQYMRKPNLAVYYFKNALDRLDSQESPSSSSSSAMTTSWVTQSQVLYNIGISLLHAKRSSVAFEILLEVVGAHYLDPHVWYHLAECCITAHQADQPPDTPAAAVGQLGVGTGMTHKLVAANPSHTNNGQTNNEAGTAASLSLEFGYICLKNAENLLPSSSGNDNTSSRVFCEGVGYIGNPITWAEVEQLRAAVIACKSYTALALHDYIPALHHAETLLTISPLPCCYTLLAHLYAAESLILQDRLSEAITHLDPEVVGGGWEANDGWYPGTSDSARLVVQYNLAVGYALREEWDKASSLISQLYKDNQDVSVQVLLLVLYVSLKEGKIDKARRIVRDRCPIISRHKEKN